MPILDALADDVLPAVERGEIKPVVDVTVDAAESGKALERLFSGTAVGKVVVTFDA